MLILEQHQFVLYRSIYMQFFFIRAPVFSFYKSLNVGESCVQLETAVNGI